MFQLRSISFLVLLILAQAPLLTAQTLVVSNDTTVCYGEDASLLATLVEGGYGTDSYTFEVYPYSPETYTGGTGVTFDSNGDDRIAGPFDIGFSFCFFNQYYTQFWIGSNGWIGFTYDPLWTTFVPTPIPNQADGVPKNCIMAPWQDWYPGNGGSFTPPYVFYKTIGTAPDRKLVVYWLDCPLYGCTTTLGTFQIVLNEQNSIIENHLTEKPYCSWQQNAATQGVHDKKGLTAFTATGRNCTNWTVTDESTRFVPSGVKWYVDGYPGGTIVGYGQSLVISPEVTTTYTAVVETCGGGVASADVTVSVIDPRFTYSASQYCQNEPDPVPSLIQTGGNFSASPSGLVFIDDVTGEIDLDSSTPGTYLVTRTIPTPCTYSHAITINPLPLSPIPGAPLFFRCGPGDITVSVTPRMNENYFWFDMPSGGTQYPQTGTVLTTPVTTTTIFYVEAIDTLTGCVSASRTQITGEVREVPVIINSVTDFQICSGDTATIIPESSIPGSSLAWVATGSSLQVTGFSSGSGDTISQKLVNSATSYQTVTYRVTATSDLCPSIPVDFTVTVVPVAGVIFIPSSQSVCSETQTSIMLNSGSPDVTFTWTATGTSGITGYAPGTGDQIGQQLFNPGYFPGSVTYTVTPAIGSCPGTPGNVIVTVYPIPHVSFQRCLDTVTTTEAAPLLLRGGIPPGGEYSGPGVNSSTGIFTPADAGTGIHQIRYSYTNMHGCMRQDSLQITVQFPALFQCGDSLLDIRDGQIYPTVLIGSQCWMASNLNYGQQINGNVSQRDNCIPEKYCYNNLVANCNSSGALYQWDEVISHQPAEGAQGFCPPGWHLPAEWEWATLFSNFVNNGFAGIPLKAPGFSGFNALVSGILFQSRSWKYPLTDLTLRSTLFWSSTIDGPLKAWAHGMNEVVVNTEFTPSVSLYPSLRNNACAVRCVKD